MTTDVTSTHVRELNESDFDEIVATTEVLLVDFWAPWCGPCLQLAPVLEAYVAANPKVTLAKVNVDENVALSQRFQVMSIPTIMLYVNGELALRFAGSVGAAELTKRLSTFI
jgi:thioredoxin 1